MPRYAPSIKFFKRKKEKKESHSSSVRFQKSKFFRKNTTRYVIEIGSVKSEVKCILKLFGWRFFLKPAGLELAFLNTWNLTLLPFFLFLFVLTLYFFRLFIEYGFFLFLAKSFKYEKKVTLFVYINIIEM